MKQKAIVWIALGVLSSCNSPQDKNTATGGPNEQTTSNRAKLFGKWLQPIPGMEKQKQGFKLSENGVAASLNTHVLQYEKWMVSQDTLFLWYHTKGVQQTSSGIDTLLIQKLEGNNLTVSPLGASPEENESYTKEE